MKNFRILLAIALAVAVLVSVESTPLSRSKRQVPVKAKAAAPAPGKTPAAAAKTPGAAGKTPVVAGKNPAAAATAKKPAGPGKKPAGAKTSGALVTKAVGSGSNPASATNAAIASQIPVNPSIPANPSLQSFSLPNMPSIPGFSLPNMPSIPGFSLPNMPSIPGFSLPNMPSIPGFSIPGFSLPPMPPAPTFTLPTISIPSIPGLSSTALNPLNTMLPLIAGSITDLSEKSTDNPTLDNFVNAICRTKSIAGQGDKLTADQQDIFVNDIVKAMAGTTGVPKSVQTDIIGNVKKSLLNKDPGLYSVLTEVAKFGDSFTNKATGATVAKSLMPLLSKSTAAGLAPTFMIGGMTF